MKKPKNRAAKVRRDQKKRKKMEKRKRVLKEKKKRDLEIAAMMAKMTDEELQDYLGLDDDEFAEWLEGSIEEQGEPGWD